MSRLALAACLTLVAVNEAPAQSAPAENLDQLAQRAQSVLDTNPQEAVDLYKQVLSQRRDWGEGWLYLGAGLYSLNRYDEAVDAFKKGITLDPGKGPGWAFLGLCEFELKDYDHALAHIAKGEALGLGANHQFESVVRQRGALILIHASRFDEAITQLQPLFKFQDNSPGVVLAAGLCALAISKMPNELSPQELAIVNAAGRAQWAATSQRPAEADAAFRQLLEEYPNEQGVHYAYGLYLMESDQEAALTEFRKETHAHPSLWPALLISASLETKQGSPQTAIEDIQKALPLTPAIYTWLCHAELAKAYLSMNQAEKAVTEFQSAIRQQPANAQLHFYLEQAYSRAGRKEDAQREKAEFLRLKTQQDPLSMSAKPAANTTGAVR